jgi:threonine/homoserine/homoserine lactone efflux protein
VSSFVQGLVLGFSIAAPVGPIGLLCVRRSLADGRVAGFVSGLGAATADAIYGVVAALGLTALTHGLVTHRAWLECAGGAFLLYLGVATLRARPATGVGPTEKSSRLSAAYGSTLVLTLANPMTILSFLGIFAAVGVGPSGADGPRAVMLVVGVFLGSCAWWLLLTTLAGSFRRHLDAGGLRALNIVSGLIIGGFGVWQLLTVVRR